MNKIRYKDSYKLTVFCIVFVFLGLLPQVSFAQSENINITTYYPSPYGVYKTLRLFPTAAPIGFSVGGPCANTGEVFYHAIDSQVYVCMGSPGTWQILGGGQGLWTHIGNSLYTANNAWNVGIGTNDPQAKLDVRGNSLQLTSQANAVIRAEATNLGSNASLDLRSGTDTNAWSITALNTSNNLRIARDSSSSFIEITPDGNVGIGTANPDANYRLDVQGKLKAKNIWVTKYDINCGLNWCTASIIFPVGKFSQAPVVVCSAGPCPDPLRVPKATIPVSCGVRDETRTGFTAVIGTHDPNRLMNGWVTIYVMAVEPTD